MAIATEITEKGVMALDVISGVIDEQIGAIAFALDKAAIRFELLSFKGIARMVTVKTSQLARYDFRAFAEQQWQDFLARAFPVNSLQNLQLAFKPRDILPQKPEWTCSPFEVQRVKLLPLCVDGSGIGVRLAVGCSIVQSAFNDRNPDPSWEFEWYFQVCSIDFE